MTTTVEKRDRTRKKDNPGEPVKNGTKGSFGEIAKTVSDAPLPTEATGADDIYVSPTGVLVYDGDPHTDEWFETRRNGITATDLPKILGHSGQYGNALDVWLDKQGVPQGERDSDLDELAYWGTVMEEPVAQRWAAETGFDVDEVGIIAHETRNWQRASLDRMVHGCPDGPCSLEIKTRSEYKIKDFADGNIPQDILDQCEWGRSTAGFSHTHLAVLAGRKFFAFDIPANETLEKRQLKEAEQIWQQHLDGTPPTVTPNGDGSLIKTMDRLYSDRQGSRPVDLMVVTPLLEEYNKAHEVSAAAETRKTAAKEALIVALDDGDMALGADGEPLFTYIKSKPTNTVLAANLKTLEKNDPTRFRELRDAGLITYTKSSPRFSMKSDLGKTPKPPKTPKPTKETK